MTKHPQLQPISAGTRRELQTSAGDLSFYVDGPPRAPLVLVHSVNAAGSAYEMLPLYQRYRATRRVYALDLPGFGFSQRGPREYTPALMTDAVRAMVGLARKEANGEPVDVIALSLGCEFAARAATQEQSAFRTLCLISPTGLAARTPRSAPAGTTRGSRLLLHALMLPGKPLFALLTRPAVIDYFLARTYGSKAVDPGLARYAWLTSHQPGAERAPLYFLSGLLFSADIASVYRALDLPVLIVHGVRGDFVDYRRKDELLARPNWSCRVLPTGALPHFEAIDSLAAAYDAFQLTAVSSRMSR